MSVSVTAAAARLSADHASLPHLVRWLSRYALGRYPALLAVLGVMLLKTALDVLKPWPMKVLVDHALSDRPAPQWLAAAVERLPGAATPEGLIAWSVASTVVLFLCTWAVGVASAYASISFGQRMTYDLAGDLFSHLQRLSLRFHARKSVGDTIRRITSDCGCVSVIIKDALLPFVAAGISLLAMVGVMWQLEPTLTLLSMAVLPWMMWVLRRYMTPLLERSYEEQEAEGRMYDVVERTLAAVPVVQAFGREADADRRFVAASNAVVDASVASVIVGLKFRVLTATATAVGTAAVLWVGARSVLDGQLTVGGILVFISYLAALYAPLQAIMYTPATTQGAAGSARRVLEIFDTSREVDDRPAARNLGPVKGHIAFDRVTFGYDPERPIIHEISLEALPGETIALVGHTGAGKSTVVGFLPRFYDPWRGKVTLDGHDLRDLRLDSLRTRVAVVLQEPFLFPLSIADNIAYGRPHASRSEIEAAARAANAHAFIERLPEGYATMVGERGATLSGGERQRLSIARALLKDAPVLILDEPTSAVDAATESLLLEALTRLMKGRTTFIIAHRLSTVRSANRIVVLREGRIAESGTHADLLARGGVYARFHALQFRQPEEGA